MAFFGRLTLQQWVAIAVNAYNAVAAVPANTGPGSTLGSIAYAGGSQALALQQQLIYLSSIARLYTIPALPNGQPSPDAISFCAPFGISPIGSVPAQGTLETGNGFLFTTPSPVSGGPLIIPVGGVIQTPGGLQFVVIADPGNSNYNSGDNGYPIPNGHSSTVVSAACLTSGSIGNLTNATTLSPFNSAGVQPILGILSITNQGALTNGQDGESDAAFKQRFTLTVSSGRAGTINAIIGAVLDIQTGLIYSFGDRVNEDGSEHDAYFTFILNKANTGTGPPGSLLTAARAAINSIFGRSAGCSFQVLAPTLIDVNLGSSSQPVTIYAAPGFNGPDVVTAAIAQATAFVNAIGLNPDTTPTLCSLAQVYRALLNTTINGVQCVSDVTGLTLNGSAGDLTAAFGNQFVFGSANFTAG